MTDLTKTTFIITLNLESNDRIRNSYIVLNYLLNNFNTKIIIKEVDTFSKCEQILLPLLSSSVESSVLSSNLQILFEKIDPSGIFHKSRYVNDLAEFVDTEVLCTYDIDVILPLQSYTKCQDMCSDDFDLVFPYEIGDNQIMVYIEDLDKIKNDKRILKFDGILELSSFQKKWMSTFGHVQFFKTKSFRSGFMMNENFSSYSPEDIEIGTRFEKLNYNVGRIDNKIIHIEHSRGINSLENNFTTNQNNLIWKSLRDMSKNQLIDYYSQQLYYKKRINSYVKS